MSGVFDTLNPASSEHLGSFGVGTWNANGLFCVSDYTKMCRKVKLLIKNIKKSNIFCVQEAHGNLALLNKHLRKLLVDYWVVSSFVGQGAGGVLVFVSKKSVPDFNSISCEVLFEGRVIRVAISDSSNGVFAERQVIYNVHNFGINLASMRLICTKIKSDIDFARNDPLYRSIFVVGDFNSTACEKFAFSAPCANPGSAIVNGTTYTDANSSTRLLMRRLGDLIELDAKLPTRYDHATDTGRKLDRIFVCIPQAICPLIHWQMNIGNCPKELFVSGISDHAPVHAHLSKPTKGNGKPLPFALEIYSHPFYVIILDKLCWLEGLHHKSGFEKLLLLKHLMKGTAEIVQDHCFTHEQDSPWLVAQTLRTIARIVWTQDWKLAESLILKDPLAAKHLNVENRVVTIVNFREYAEETDTAQTYTLRLQSEQYEKSMIPDKKRHIKRISEMTKLWIQHERKLVLHGVILDDLVIRDEPQRTLTLGAEWQKTFDEKEFCELDARKFLDELGDFGCYDEPAPPDIFTYFRVTNSKKKTAPGPDNLPYPAWHTKHSAATLLEVDILLRTGTEAEENFNDSCCDFVPKGGDEQGTVETLREANKTRPLSRKNCDNKMIMSANTKACESQFKSITHKTQNGFVGGRNFLNNVVDMDAAGRIYSTKFFGSSEHIRSFVKNIPVFIPCDFSAAFPSIIQAWVWLVMEYRKLPRSFITLMKAMYKNARAIFVHEGSIFIIIQFLSGVLQGCPASGWLFDSAIDPFLACFHNKLEEGRKGIVRACADDLSFALSRMKHLTILFPIYLMAQILAGLTLHPNKCVIVPLCRKDDDTYLRIRKWLERNIPQWSSFKISDAAKLLGFYIGPGSGRFNWVDPFEKLVSRVKDIKSAAAPIHCNAYDFNVRVSTVLSYQAQLLPIDKRHFMLERIALHTALRTPWNTFRHADLFNIHKVGGPRFRSFCISSASALFRTAARTVTSWPHWVAQMQQAGEEHLSVKNGIQGLHYPDFWDSPSYAQNLFFAFQGFTEQPRLVQAGKCLIQILREKCGGALPPPRQRVLCETQISSEICIFKLDERSISNC